MKIKAVLTATIGGAFEWYDFIIYGFFLQIFGHQFFPQTNSKAEQFIAFIIFAVGFFARPIGGLVFGHIGDIYGRSRSLYYSMILIGFATFCLAIMPTYNQIGMLSTIIFVTLRIFQGFAIGGSISGSFIYISELSQPHNRSFWVSTVSIGLMRGIIFAALISGFLISYLTHEQLHNWGWRIAFFAGATIIILAKYSTPVMVETPYHNQLVKNQQIEKTPVAILFKKHKFAIAQCVGITAVHAVLTIFILLFMPTFLQYYGMGHKEALNINIISIMVFFCILPLFGWFGNKTSLRAILVFACILLIIFTLPILNMIASHSSLMRGSGILALTIIDCMVSATIPPIIVGMFPTNIRHCGVSFSYNLCIAIFAGITPIIIATLGNKLSSPISSTMITIIIAAVISLISTLMPTAKHMPMTKKRFSFTVKQN